MVLVLVLVCVCVGGAASRPHMAWYVAAAAVMVSSERNGCRFIAALLSPIPSSVASQGAVQQGGRGGG